jgi:NAD(P)-dependent dehydrogenase (short-subunit alcohol dehydrogenase family)
MKSIVITGSTSGIGLGLAKSFLSLGCEVTISGRSQDNLEKAYDALACKHEPDRLQAHICDVTRYDQVQSLWDAAKTRFGKVDVWINNAGVGHREIEFWDYHPDLIRDVIKVNVIGAIYGSVVALKGMKEQGFGGIYNMEGLGSSGPIIRGLAVYGTSKSALSYLTRSMAKEVEGTPILVGGLRPGMVATKLITEQYEGHPKQWERAKRIFNILSDRVETVTPWLARKVLNNHKNGVNVVWLTRFKVLWRFLVAPFHKRKIFD